jgi:hypothetical protein
MAGLHQPSSFSLSLHILEISRSKDAQRGGTTMAQSAQKEKTLLSDRIPRDTEHERYHPELEEELKECLFCLRQNEMMFDLEVDTDLIEQHIYERQALLCRYRYLLAQARELGLHTILQKYQPMGG